MISLLKNPLVLFGVVAIALSMHHANATEYTVKCGGTLVGQESIAQGTEVLSFLASGRDYQHTEEDEDSGYYDNMNVWHETFYGQDGHGDIKTAEITMTKAGNVSIVTEDEKYQNCEIQPTF